MKSFLLPREDTASSFIAAISLSSASVNPSNFTEREKQTVSVMEKTHHYMIDGYVQRAVRFTQ